MRKKVRRARLTECIPDFTSCPPLGREEETELGRRIQTLQPYSPEWHETINRLVESNIRFVVKCARRMPRFFGEHLAHGDLVQEGILGLWVAATKYNPEHGVRFLTYAGPWVCRYMMYAVANADHLIRIPTNLWEWIRQIRKAVRDNNGPRFKELCEKRRRGHYGHASGKSLVRALLAERVISLDRRVWVRGMPPDESFLLREEVKLPSSEPSPEEHAIRIQEVCSFMQHSVGLSKKEWKIIRLRFGIGGGEKHTLEEVGRRFAVTRERIRQIEARALGKLRGLLPDMGVKI